jgi:IK cytokine
MHRWDFETEEEWASYNEQKEAMPKAAFQFGVKMQDGRKTRKQNKEQKLNNELHKINKILDKKKNEPKSGGGGYEENKGSFDDDSHQNKRLRV